MLPKPIHLGAEFADQFKVPQVAAAYVHRPAYPPEVFDRLKQMLPPGRQVILDLGCGTGEIARRLVEHVDRIDAVDASAAMIAVAMASPNGRHNKLHWFCCSAEEFTYPSKYDLVIAAESFHWFDWAKVTPRIARTLARQARLVLLDRDAVEVPWQEELHCLIVRYSTNREYRPYDLVAELQKRGLFEVESSACTRPLAVRQTVADYVESLHSRNGLTRGRMGLPKSLQFDEQLTGILAKYVHGGLIEFPLSVSLTWGRPKR
jgi:SAM-dependent methyltransferase